MALEIIGSNDAGKVGTTSNNELKIAPTTTVANAGLVGVAAESAPTTDAGGRVIRALDSTGDSRLRINQDRLLYSMQSYHTVAAAPPELIAFNSTANIAYNAGIVLN